MGLISFLFIGTNTIFWAFGGTMLGVGIWMAVDPNAFDGLNATGMDDAMWAACVYTMIAVGALVFLLGFLGCFGAKRGGKGKSNTMLKIYNILVSVIILAEIVIIILAAVFWSNINEGVEKQMYDDVHNKYEGPASKDGLTDSWNKMQYKWKCCGSYNFTDYKLSKYANTTGSDAVPYTCCVYKPGEKYDSIDSVLNPVGCVEEARGYIYDPTKSYEFLNARGCFDAMSDVFSTNAAIIIGVTCGFLGLQILGMIFACIIMRD